MMISRISSLALSFLLVASLPAIGLASPTWLCSLTESLAVYADGSSGPVDLGDVEAPTFLRVSTETMEVTLLAPDSRKGEVTVIGEAKRGDEKWVLTGVENGRAWSMVISDEGFLTLSVTGDGTTWSVFGNTMLEEE